MAYKKTVNQILIFLVLTFFASGVKSARVVTEMPQLQRPSFITTKGNRLYIVEESARIHIYKVKGDGYTFLKTFGTPGEGPGEFGGYIHRMGVKEDHLEIPTRNRLARFDFDGRFLDEIRLPIPVFKNNVSRLGPNYLARNWQFDDKSRRTTIRLYGPDFTMIRELSEATDNSGGSTGIRMFADLMNFQVVVDRLYLVISKPRESRIKLFNHHGEPLGEVQLPIVGEAVTEALKERSLKPYRDDPEIKPFLADFLKSIVFPEQTPGFDYFEVIDQGFAVRSHRFCAEGVDFVFFDFEGKEIGRRALFHTGPVANGRLFAFHEGAYLYLRENEDQELWELVSETVFQKGAILQKL